MVLQEKSFAFALRIVHLYKYLKTEKNEDVLSKQLLRCGTSAGAMVRESEHAENKAAYIHKLSIAQKENHESLYWIELLYASNYIDRSQFESIDSDAKGVIKLIVSSIATARSSHDVV